MSTMIRLSLLALILSSATAATARPAYNSSLIDRSQSYGGFAPYSQEGQRAFWEKTTRGGR
jgi:hypothetical protein